MVSMDSASTADVREMPIPLALRPFGPQSMSHFRRVVGMGNGSKPQAPRAPHGPGESHFRCRATGAANRLAARGLRMRVRVLRRSRQRARQLHRARRFQTAFEGTQQQPGNRSPRSASVRAAPPGWAAAAIISPAAIRCCSVNFLASFESRPRKAAVIC